MKRRSLKKLTVATLAVALWKQHDFDHDKAYGAAHVWLKNRFAEASYAQLGARMARVKHTPEIDAVLAGNILDYYDRFRTAWQPDMLAAEHGARWRKRCACKTS